MKQLKKDGNGGFTLIELVVVMALIAILALMVIGAVVVARRMITETRHRNMGKSFQVAMESYYAANNSTYPLNWSNVTFNTARTTLSDVAADSSITCANGGGTISTSADGKTFAITPAKWDCSAGGGVYTEPK